MIHLDTELRYSITELREEPNGEVWAKISILPPAEDADLSLEGALQELERRIAPYGMKKSEALNWLLGHPNLDDFFTQILQHKQRLKQ